MRGVATSIVERSPLTPGPSLNKGRGEGARIRVSRERAPRHCERSEAIHTTAKDGSPRRPCGLLAMTGRERHGMRVLHTRLTPNALRIIPLSSESLGEFLAAHVDSHDETSNRVQQETKHLMNETRALATHVGGEGFDDQPVRLETKNQNNIAVGSRLAQARRRFFATASEAARELGLSGPTYLAHENGTRGIRTDMAEFYAQKYGVSTDWLLYNRGSMERTSVATGGITERPAARMRDVVGPEFLLDKIDVVRDPKRNFIAAAPGDPPPRLPSLIETDGYVAELVGSRGAEVGLKRVSLQRADGGGPRPELAFRDVFRLPVETIPSERAFLVRLPRNDLLEDMPGGQRVLVDPDAPLPREDDRGLYIMDDEGRLLPVFAMPIPGQPSQIRVATSRFRSRQPMTSDAFQDVVVGRVVMVLREVTEHDDERLVEKLQDVMTRGVPALPQASVSYEGHVQVPMAKTAGR
jgi:DNA-binding XRE family transcriptional regulator